MKISINIEPELSETEIIINCNSLTAETESIIAALRMADNQLTVTRDGETHILDISKIAYIESLDLCLHRNRLLRVQNEAVRNGRKALQFLRRIFAYKQVLHCAAEIYPLAQSRA